MAWLRVTQHYKGHFPMDAGGVVFGGYGQKEVVPESFADACVKQNFPYVVHCSRDGQYLDNVPAVEVKTEVLVPAVAVETPTPKSEDPATETGPVDSESDPLSASIEVETETPAQKKARLKAEKAAQKE